MNSLVNMGSNVQQMTSLEIAELVGSRHDNVKRAIERLASSGVIQLPPMEDLEKINNLGHNIKVAVYVFSGEQGKRDSIVVVAQLCPEFTATLVDRWQELEKQVKAIDPMQMLADPVAMRGLLLGYTEKVIALEHKVVEMQPDVDALQRIAKADGSLCIRDAAKALQIRQKDLFDWLKSHRWIYKRAGCSHYLGYQDKDQAGYLEHKVAEVVRSDGTTKITEQVRVTAKGLAKLAKLLGGTGGQPEGVPA